MKQIKHLKSKVEQRSFDEGAGCSYYALKQFIMLDVLSFHLPTVGSRVFPTAGVKVWNSLPDDVTSAPSLSTFQHHLKTYLFRCCYNTV